MQLSSEITRQCIKITEHFHTRTLTKVSAILELQSTIPHDEEPTHLKALGTYLHILDNFEHIHERVEPRGVGGDEDGKPGVGGGEHEDSPGGCVAGQNKRRRSQSVGMHDRSTKHKVDVSAFTWLGLYGGF